MNNQEKLKELKKIHQAVLELDHNLQEEIKEGSFTPVLEGATYEKNQFVLRLNDVTDQICDLDEHILDDIEAIEEEESKGCVRSSTRYNVNRFI